MADGAHGRAFACAGGRFMVPAPSPWSNGAMTSDRGTPRRSLRLTEQEAADVRALADRVTRHDGVAGLSERTLLDLDAPDRSHVLSEDGPRLIGYSQVWPEHVAELVVDPAFRREGHGDALWQETVAAGATSVWAHGDLPQARAFAADHGLVRTRELHRMERPLTRHDLTAPELPEGFAVETYATRRNPEELLQLNARAFAHHAEQGHLGPEDLAARMAPPWFDPAGLLYLVDAKAPRGSGPAAFHWTKRPVETPDRGEVYVLGIDPAYQGRGLAQPLTRLGLAHLATVGAHVVELYVDGDNEAAIRTYRRTGFDIIATDVVYSLPR